MAQLPCPIPQVEAALQPYIKSRHEVQQIRRLIGAKLQEGLGPGTSVARTLLSPTCAEVQSFDTSFKPNTLHKQFVDALAAHKRAQEKYKATKADLSNLKESIRDTQNELTTQPSYNIRGYVDLVGQRTHKDRMELVRNALAKLERLDPHPAKADIKNNVKELIGSPPEPPNISIDQTALATEIEELSYNLKKSLLRAKAEHAAAISANEVSALRVQSLGKVGLEVKTLALRRARDELLRWIESELSKAAEELEEDEAHDNDPTLSHDDHEYTAQEIQTQVQNLYERYIVSRRRLIFNIEAINEVTSHDVSSTSINPKARQPKEPTSAPASTIIPATHLLSHLPVLMQGARDEATVIQQTAHLRKQVNLASSETIQTIQRLAGESHLVTPGTSDLSQWEAATSESSASTAAAVQEHIKSGRSDILHARQVLMELQARRSALAHLQGNK